MTGFVYAVKSGDAVKIGWARIPERRVAELNVGSASRHELIGYVAGTKEQEAECHRLLSPHRIRGEWFDGLATTVAAFVELLPKKIKVGNRFGAKPSTGSALATYLQEQNLTDDAFAQIIGLERSVVTKLRNGRIGPSAKSAARIIRATNGAVGIEDLVSASPSPGHVSTPSTAPDTAKEAA